MQYHRNKDRSIASSTTLPTLNDLEQVDKVIQFSKNDIAFRVDEDRRKVSIVRIKKEVPEMEFVLEKAEELSIVQEVLRRKLCELGFEDKYIRLSELGKGATARVYLVERKSDGKKFAAKIISLKTADNK